MKAIDGTNGEKGQISAVPMTQTDRQRHIRTKEGKYRHYEVVRGRGKNIVI